MHSDGEMPGRERKKRNRWFCSWKLALEMDIVDCNGALGGNTEGKTGTAWYNRIAKKKYLYLKLAGADCGSLLQTCFEVSDLGLFTLMPFRQDRISIVNIETYKHKSQAGGWKWKRSTGDDVQLHDQRGLTCASKTANSRAACQPQFIISFLSQPTDSELARLEGETSPVIIF